MKTRFYSSAKVLNPLGKGFVGTVFLAIALVSIVVAAFAVMNRSTKSSTDDSALAMNVSIVLKIASDYKQAVEMKAASGTPSDEITFDQSPTGIFNLADRYATEQKIPLTAIEYDEYYPAGQGFSSARIPGIGSSLAADRVFAVAVEYLHCRRINKMLHGSTALPSSTASSGQWLGYESQVDDSSRTTNYAGRSENCVLATDGYTIYYKVMVER